MKPLFIFIALIIVSSNLYSQTDSLLWGKWKVVASFDGNILHDYKTDSILQLSTRKKILSKSELLDYTRTTKSIFQNNIFEFSRDGLFKHSLGDQVHFQGNYKVDNIQQLITASKTDAWKRTLIEMFKYSTDGHYMNLLIMDKKEPPLVNTTFPLVFKLEKIN